MDSFQLTLPSNACGEIYKQNKPNHYWTQLNSPLRLEGRWEVALVDIMYPHNWFNYDVETKVVIDYNRGDYNYISNLTISPQDFESPTILCKRLNGWLELERKGGMPTHVDYDETSQRCQIKIDHADVHTFLYFSNKAMENPLGMDFTLEKVIEGQKYYGFEINKTTANRKPSFNNHPIMFVYSKSVEDQLVGSGTCPLLAVLPTTGAAGDQVYWHCNPLTYLPVRGTQLDEIDIRLATETGDPFPIVGHVKVIARLQFRRRYG